MNQKQQMICRTEEGAPKQAAGDLWSGNHPTFEDIRRRAAQCPFVAVLLRLYDDGVFDRRETMMAGVLMLSKRLESLRAMTSDADAAWLAKFESDRRAYVDLFRRQAN
jgi:hypothetical protein